MIYCTHYGNSNKMIETQKHQQSFEAPGLFQIDSGLVTLIGEMFLPAYFNEAYKLAILKTKLKSRKTVYSRKIGKEVWKTTGFWGSHQKRIKSQKLLSKTKVFRGLFPKQDRHKMCDHSYKVNWSPEAKKVSWSSVNWLFLQKPVKTQ